MAKNIKDVLFLSQARLSSERVPGKMMRPFADTNLVEIVCDKILESKVIPKENFYLSAFDNEIKNVAISRGLNVYNRSEKSALSEGPMQEVMEYHDKLPFKYVVVISACTPFLSTDTIDKFAKSYLNSDCEGMFGVIPKNNYFWDKDGNLITEWPNGQDVLNTKFVGITYEAAHCLYAGRMDLISDGIWMGRAPYTKGNPKLFPVPEKEVLDIDYEWQFKLAETLYKQGYQNEL